MNTTDWLDTPFRLWLGDCPARLRNALDVAEKRTLRDVVSMTEPEVLALRNVGEATLYELKEKLLALGLRLGELPPEPEEPRQSDMLLRDYFAGQAMVGILANHTTSDTPSLAAVAYGVADAMLDERVRMSATRGQPSHQVYPAKVASRAESAPAAGTGALEVTG